MNEQFKVKDICIGQNFISNTKYNNVECEIIGGLEMRHWGYAPTGGYIDELCYNVRWVDGVTSNEKPINLRRKPPKQSDKEWAEGKVREITQDSVHVGGGSKHLIPEETA